jgi:hypothetical protein
MLGLSLAVLSIAWSGVLAFDIIVFALTVYKAIKVGYKVPLIRGLVRDGKRFGSVACQCTYERS